MEPIRQNLGLLTDVDLLDEVRLKLRRARAGTAANRSCSAQSAKTLVTEMESLTSLVDSFASSATRSDDGPQSETPRIVAVHIKGMKVSVPGDFLNSA